MKKNLFLSIILLLCLQVNTTLKAQQDGALDPTFGIGGRTNVYASGNTDNIYSVMVLPDGKILFGGYANYAGVAGNGDIYIGKLNPDGSADYTFGSGGLFTVSNGNYSDVRDMAVMNDGSIVFGGSKTSGNKGATMGRITADGANVIVTPTGPTYASTTINNEPTCMAYNSSANRVVVGGYVYTTVSYMFAHSFNLDGTANTAFSSDGSFYFGDAPAQNVTYAKAIAMLDDGSVLLGGSSSSGAISLVKLRSDGTLDQTFGSASPPSGIEMYSLGTSGSIEGMLVLPDGRIMVCGTTNSNFFVARFTANGIYDNTFPVAIYNYAPSGTESFNSMLLQPDGKIIASGTSVYGSPTGIAVRYKTNGVIDSTFGNAGVLSFPNMEINASSISVSEKKVVFAGNYGGQMSLVKIKYDSQKYNIIGKDEVSVESENSYQIHPLEPGYTYYWNYSGLGTYPLSSTAADEFTLYFSENATAGTLSCQVYDLGGNPIKTATKEITINGEPTLAELLADVLCDPVQTYAQDNYINTFKFIRTKLGSTNTGASITGYDDLTASSNYDTLYAGDNYQAELECVTTYGGIVYCGIWIDFNNNGKITEDEFVGSAASDSKIFTVNNIVIPTDLEHGPKRVRVRVRQTAPFNNYEACMSNEEFSETEDYLIVLSSYDEIQAPNFITPNNDGKNDNFIVRGAKKDVNNSLKVFNRVGDLVYEKDNYDNSWGGSDNAGGQLKAGTYYFVFTQHNEEKAKEDVVKGFFEIRY